MCQLGHSARQSINRFMRKTTEDALGFAVGLDLADAKFWVRIVRHGFPFTVQTPPGGCLVLSDNVPHLDSADSIASDKRKRREKI